MNTLIRRNPIRPSATKAFTLVELLVVVAIIAILAAVLLPSLGSAKANANRTTCISNLKQINSGLRLYTDDSADMTPSTPRTRTNHSSVWSGYKRYVRSYVGEAGLSSPQDRLFACPADIFYYTSSNNATVLVNKSFHDQPYGDYSSYAFNGGNLNTNLERFGIDYTQLGIAGRKLSSIKRPARTALVFEVPASGPFSWHHPKLPLSPASSRFNDAMNVVSFVDGHASYIKIYWSDNFTNGMSLSSTDENPPPGYDYQWSGN